MNRRWFHWLVDLCTQCMRPKAYCEMYGCDPR